MSSTPQEIATRVTNITPQPFAEEIADLRDKQAASFTEAFQTDEPILEENWLEKRRRYIGGSDSASMFADPSLPTFGKDGIKYGCARRLVYQKRGQEPDYKHTRSEEQLFSRGHELEPIAADKFRRENGLGLKIRKAAPHRMSPTHTHAGVNLDREIVGVSSEQILNLFGQRDVVTGPGYLEVKSASEFVFKEVTSNSGVNIDYVFQMQHGLAVKRWEWGIFAVLGYGPSLWGLSWFPMIADKKLGDRILQRTNEIWDMVEGKTAMPPALPQPDKNDRCTKCQFRKTCLGESFVPAEPGDGVYHLREDLTDLMVQYRENHAVQEAAEEAKKELAAKLMDVVNKNDKWKSTPVTNGNGESVELMGRRQYSLEDRIDTKALTNEMPEIAAKYSRPYPKDFVVITERKIK